MYENMSKEKLEGIVKKDPRNKGALNALIWSKAQEKLNGETNVLFCDPDTLEENLAEVEEDF